MKPDTHFRKNQRLRQHAIILGFLGLVLLAFLTLSLFDSKSQIDIVSTNKPFYGLHRTYKESGMEEFLNEKKVLKKQLTETLKNPKNTEDASFAANIALYLFPETLSDADFEKQVAQDQWAPLQAAIEKVPHSDRSRLWFQEMRANIWNYESPDLAAPKISVYSREVLKIYNELSSLK